eukprot:355094-Chlamydomonas_euryale.AAC.8
MWVWWWRLSSRAPRGHTHVILLGATATPRRARQHISRRRMRRPCSPQASRSRKHGSKSPPLNPLGVGAKLCGIEVMRVALRLADYPPEALSSMPCNACLQAGSARGRTAASWTAFERQCGFAFSMLYPHRCGRQPWLQEGGIRCSTPTGGEGNGSKKVAYDAHPPQGREGNGSKKVAKDALPPRVGKAVTP